MKTKKRKQRPEPPKIFWFDTDCCWFCTGAKRNGCGGCKVLKKYNREYGNKKYEFKQKTRRNSEYE